MAGVTTSVIVFVVMVSVAVIAAIVAAVATVSGYSKPVENDED